MVYTQDIICFLFISPQICNEETKVCRQQTDFPVHYITISLCVAWSTLGILYVFCLFLHRYVMKRLKFVGNKQISQGVTLLYLSVWHGLHSGYYMNFFLEFIMLNGETQVNFVGAYRKFPKYSDTQNICCNHSKIRTTWPYN